ncbi:MAG: hypothetical protein L0Z55_07140, partial [Planctomycetes bacterium]|nr:hypothetical protein [Planctomycetota bacterium]
NDAQAEVDTCKIEHLVSSETARLATRLLRFLGAGGADAQRFLTSLSRFTTPCSRDPKRCPLLCEDRCIEEFLSEPDPIPHAKG